MPHLRTLIINSITTAKGDAFDVMRIGAVVGGVALIALQVMAIMHGQHFDPLTFGAALAAIFAGAGGAIALKTKDEQNQP